MEPIAQKERVERVRKKLKFNNMFCVPVVGISGGLGLLWINSFDVQILHYYINFIHTTVKEKKIGNLYEMTSVYSNPTFDRRRSLWRKLENLMPRRNGLWCCVGDFNEMCYVTEKDGTRPVAPIRLSLFRDFLNSTGLMDIDLKGNKFTWDSNPRDGVVTYQKNDRILVNLGVEIPVSSSYWDPSYY